MAYVYSTASTSIAYNVGADRIIINGGANVSNKHLWTPKGASTRVTNDQLEALKKIPSFAKKMQAGFFSVSQFEKDAGKVARDMTEKDGSAQLTESDLAEGSAPVSHGKKKKGK